MPQSSRRVFGFHSVRIAPRKRRPAALRFAPAIQSTPPSTRTIKLGKDARLRGPPAQPFRAGSGGSSDVRKNVPAKAGSLARSLRGFVSLCENHCASQRGMLGRTKQPFHQEDPPPDRFPFPPSCLPNSSIHELSRACPCHFRGVKTVSPITPQIRQKLSVASLQFRVPR
jgi:hypothetical protein